MAELEGLRILMVDDDDDTRDVVCRLLQAAGATVTAASNTLQGDAVEQALPVTGSWPGVG